MPISIALLVDDGAPVNPMFFHDPPYAHDLLMPNTLARDFARLCDAYGVRGKFSDNNVPPDQDPDDIILGIIADTTLYYGFKDLDKVRLHNLRQEKTYLFERDQLKTYGEESAGRTPTGPAGKGKIIHIRFDNGNLSLDNDPVQENAATSTN